MLLDYGTLRLIWWALLGVLLVGFAIMDGFDLGVAMLTFRAQERKPAPRPAQYDRAGLGGKSGLVHSRRRRRFRRLAVALRSLFLRLLSGDDAGAPRAYPAAGGVNLSR